MTDYTKATDFAVKDALLTGNPLKLVKGVDIDTEFNNIATAIATKLDTNDALGTPASGVLTNCTGLPVSTGISGFGTGVATALAVNIGTAGSPVTNGGALGTPSSGVLTNCTGTASGLTAGGNALLAGSASQAFSALTLTSAGTVRGNTTAGASTGSAVVGVSSAGGWGVYGESVSNAGVYGKSTSGTAITAEGVGTTATGIYAIFGAFPSSPYAGAGVHGGSTTGVGVVAESDTTSPARSAFRIVPQDAEPTTGEIGDIYVTTAGVLKICTVAGTPGTWVSVGTQT